MVRWSRLLLDVVEVVDVPKKHNDHADMVLFAGASAGLARSRRTFGRDVHERPLMWLLIRSLNDTTPESGNGFVSALYQQPSGSVSVSVAMAAFLPEEAC
jgi:hypothetical protein